MSTVSTATAVTKIFEKNVNGVNGKRVEKKNWRCRFFLTSTVSTAKGLKKNSCLFSDVNGVNGVNGKKVEKKFMSFF